MFTVPTWVYKAGRAVGKFWYKHGHEIMVVGGTGMVLGGVVSACKATLKADEVIDQHRYGMAQIREAERIRDDDSIKKNPNFEYTEKDALRDKIQVYTGTAVKFAKLYGPSVAMIIGGLTCIDGAYAIMRGRHANAVAALSSVDAAFQNYRNKVEKELGVEKAAELERPLLEEKDITVIDENGEEKVIKRPVADPETLNDPFTIWLGEWKGDGTPQLNTHDMFNLNERWHEGLSRGALNLNYAVIEGTVRAWQFEMDAQHRDTVWFNDIRRSLDCSENGIGHDYGWCNRHGSDPICVRIQPYLCYDNYEDSEQFPMYVPVDKEELEDIFLAIESGEMDYSEFPGYALAATFCRADGSMPRMVYNECYA